MSVEPHQPQDGKLPAPADLADIDTAVATGNSLSQGQMVRRRFFRHKLAMTSLVVLIGVAILAFTSIGFGSWSGWWSKNFTSTYPVTNLGAPTLQLWPFTLGEHPFGQDNIGKDYFALTMRGIQRTLIIAFFIGVFSTFIGMVIGALAGYFRGLLESILMRLTDVVIIVPTLVLAAVVGQIGGGSGIMVLAIMLSLVTWTGLARLMRAEVLSLREREFVAAARAMGASPARILIKHIIPNTVGVVVVNATLAIAGAILLESSLSFLGFGVQPPDTSLGLLISTYQNAFNTRPWLFWWPGLFILVIALAVNFLGDGLRDAFDPRQQNKKG